jgi:hypothetical protein
MMHSKIFIMLLSVLGLLATSGLWLYAQQGSLTSKGVAPATTTLPQLIAPPVATPGFITVNIPTTVTVSAQITDPALLPGGVNLLRLATTGTPATILGVMHDDGLNGDAVAGDHVYTLQAHYNESVSGQIQLQISAAFRGLLRRSSSGITAVVVSTSATETSFVSTNSQLPVSFMYPSSLDPSYGQSDNSLELCPLDDDLCSGGLGIAPGDPTLSQELSDLSIGVQVLSQTTESINGIQWTILVAQDQTTGLMTITGITEHNGATFTVGSINTPNQSTILFEVLARFAFN